jgi:muramoyltetrapeptide carboxypeptidase
MHRAGAAHPKVLLGSSDITVLHTVLGQGSGVVSLLGAMPASSAFTGSTKDSEDTRQAVFEALFGPERRIVLGGAGTTTLGPGQAQGMTVGGNLSMVASALGDSTIARPPAGAIGVLEDTAEPPYRIDRLLTQLLRAGWLQRLGGLALGTWHACGDEASVREVLRDRLGSLGIPVLAGLSVGHGLRQLTLPLGAEATVDADAGTLTVLRPE